VLRGSHSTTRRAKIKDEPYRKPPPLALYLTWAAMEPVKQVSRVLITAIKVDLRLDLPEKRTVTPEGRKLHHWRHREVCDDINVSFALC